MCVRLLHGPACYDLQAVAIIPQFERAIMKTSRKGHIIIIAAPFQSSAQSFDISQLSGDQGVNTFLYALFY